MNNPDLEHIFPAPQFSQKHGEQNGQGRRMPGEAFTLERSAANA